MCVIMDRISPATITQLACALDQHPESLRLEQLACPSGKGHIAPAHTMVLYAVAIGLHRSRC